MTAADFPDWQAPQAHATAIAGTGVPLLTAKDLLMPRQVVNVIAGAQNTFSAVTFTQPSYELFVMVSGASGGTAGAVQDIQLQWSDSVSGQQVDQEDYLIQAPSGVNTVVIGRGPAKADQLTIVLFNHDAVTVTYTVVMWQHSQVATLTRWYTQLLGSNYVGYTPATGNPTAALLASVNPSLSAGTSLAYLLPLFTGRVLIHASSTSAWDIRLNSLDPNAVADTQVWAQTGAAGASVIQEIILPRAQCSLVVKNTSTVLANVGCHITADAA